MQFLQRLEASRNEDEPEDNNNWERVLSPDQATNSIAVNLMSSLVDLLFIRNFTVASSVSKSLQLVKTINYYMFGNLVLEALRNINSQT